MRALPQTQAPHSVPAVRLGESQGRISKYGTLIVVLLAPFLGGSTERWSEGVILFLLGLLVFLHPPRSFGHRGFAAVAGIFLALAAAAFLPAGWFGVTGWRQRLLEFGVPIASTLSPQPCLSGESMVLLIAGVTWIYWLSLQTRQAVERRRLAMVFVCGAAVLAAVALVANLCKINIPFWHSEWGFGPFPNRNQTGNFFAISGVVSIGCAYEWARKKKLQALIFAAATLVICAALVLSYSRAAVLLFFAGAAIWAVALGCLSRSVKSIAICVSVLMLLGAAFLLFGGQTMERFQKGEGVTFGFRMMIYKDALALIHASPWSGIGIGNFAGVFPLFRNASAMPSRIIHPESDCLWLGAEMGWGGVMLVLIALGVLSRRIFPLEHGTNRLLRLACASAAMVFVLHGLVDVPGHRIGSVFPALFLLSIALNNPTGLREHRQAPVFFRIVVGLLAIAGAVWMYAGWEGVSIPGEIGVQKTKQRAQGEIGRGAYDSAVVAVAKALDWAPLDWELYFLRASAEAREGNWPRAFDDFRRVNLLESTSPLVTFAEGEIWAETQPTFALSAWRETLRRSPPPDAAQYYARMLGEAADLPVLRKMLHALASRNFDLELICLADASTDELKAGVSSILKKDPDLHSLTDAQKTSFFRLWARSGDVASLDQHLSDNPEWKRLAWRQVALHRSSEGDFRGACEIALQSMSSPVLPTLKTASEVADLHRKLLSNPHDFMAGYALYSKLSAEKDDAAALEVVQKFTALPGCPRYFYFLEAELEFRLGDYATAWAALEKYEPIDQ